MALAGLLLLPGLAADGAESERGGALYKQRSCDSCHGEFGSQPIAPEYPILAGQSATYLLRQMIDIRDGHRTNGQSATMREQVQEVSDTEFAAIADWLSRQY
jgi:cytochrome c